MPDQKIEEFRELAMSAVVAPDSDVLLQRGRARRRRRQLAPVVAAAAVIAIVVGMFATGGDPRTDQPPAVRPSQSTPSTPDPEEVPVVRFLSAERERLEPGGVYGMDGIGSSMVDTNGVLGATVTVAGDGWRDHWARGAYQANRTSGVTWSLARPYDLEINDCPPGDVPVPLTEDDAVDQLTAIPGAQVLSAPRPATKLGVGGTHLRLRIPAGTCPTGPPDVPLLPRVLGGPPLFAMFEGPSAPAAIVDVWFLVRTYGEPLLLVKAVRGDPPPAMLDELDRTLESIRLVGSD